MGLPKKKDQGHRGINMCLIAEAVTEEEGKKDQGQRGINMCLIADGVNEEEGPRTTRGKYVPNS